MSLYNPDWRPHRELEREFDAYLTARGYLVSGGLTYHEALPPEMVKVLGRRNSPTAQYIRTRADRLAVHNELPIEFQWEAKTAGNPKYHNMAIEALPLANHIINARCFGVGCLYAYHNPYTFTHAGFWAEEIPTPCALNIPARKGSAESESFIRVFNRLWPGVPVNYTGRTSGSGDPYVLIHADVVQQLSHWKTLIELLERKAA